MVVRWDCWTLTKEKYKQFSTNIRMSMIDNCIEKAIENKSQIARKDISLEIRNNHKKLWRVNMELLEATIIQYADKFLPYWGMNKDFQTGNRDRFFQLLEHIHKKLEAKDLLKDLDPIIRYYYLLPSIHRYKSSSIGSSLPPIPPSINETLEGLLQQAPSRYATIDTTSQLDIDKKLIDRLINQAGITQKMAEHEHLGLNQLTVKLIERAIRRFADPSGILDKFPKEHYLKLINHLNTRLEKKSLLNEIDPSIIYKHLYPAQDQYLQREKKKKNYKKN